MLRKSQFLRSSKWQRSSTAPVVAAPAAADTLASRADRASCSVVIASIRGAAKAVTTGFEDG